MPRSDVQPLNARAPMDVQSPSTHSPGTVVMSVPDQLSQPAYFELIQKR